MFELARKEPDGSITLIKIFRDDQEKEIDQFILRACQETHQHISICGPTYWLNDAVQLD